MVVTLEVIQEVITKFGDGSPQPRDTIQHIIYSTSGHFIRIYPHCSQPFCQLSRPCLSLVSPLLLQHCSLSSSWNHSPFTVAPAQPESRWVSNIPSHRVKPNPTVSNQGWASSTYLPAVNTYTFSSEPFISSGF